MELSYTAVIFTSHRTSADPEGYSRAAQRMDDLVRSQPGYRSHQSVREPSGLGITVSYWDSPESALAWKGVQSHLDVQRSGARHWYSWYRVEVATVLRHYESVESRITQTHLLEES